MVTDPIQPSSEHDAVQKSNPGSFSSPKAVLGKRKAPAAGKKSAQKKSSKSKKAKKDAGSHDPNAGVDVDVDQMEDNNVVEDDEPIDDEEEGEDLEDNFEKDYEPRPELDHYRISELDDNDYEDIDPETRAAAERELNRRDGVNEELPEAFEFISDFWSNDTALGRMRRRQDHSDDIEPRSSFVPNDESMVPDYLPEIENLLDIKARSYSEWIANESVRRTIAKRFKAFLTKYHDEQGNNVYGNRIRNMSIENKESLPVSYAHLSSMDPELAYLVVYAPTEVLKVFNEIAFEVVLLEFPEYERIHSEIHIRITDLTNVESLRSLRQIHLNQLIRVSGVVTRRTGVYPQLKSVFYDCGKCKTTFGPFTQDLTAELKVLICPNEGCMSKGPFSVNVEETKFRNYQKLTLQESPGTVPPGRLPRSREVILLADLIDSARPGEEIDVTGIYRNAYDPNLNAKNGFPVFRTIIEAVNVAKKEDDFASFSITSEDEAQILELAKDERIGERIFKSIAPSIYGHDGIKKGLALSMFGGVRKDVRGKHALRGDINVLLLGDPGTAKSQFLKYVEKTAHRAVFTTGQGASAVGLTASVHKDTVTGEWTLEGGALVLADNGVCLIDEFDKMNDADRVSIHEAMEQQSISISKAGIVTTLQARCAIIAAANPIRGRYDPSVTFAQNVQLTEPILSRFDVLCVVKDTADPVDDERLADFVLRSHTRSHPDFIDGELDAEEEKDPDILPQHVLRKYIMYARERVRPTLNNPFDHNKIAKLYADLRRESVLGGSVPITVRHVESIIRLSEAHARMHLRDHVRNDDVDAAISVALESFVSAQKYTVMNTMRKSLSKYINHKKDANDLLLHVLQSLVRDEIRFYQYVHGRDADTIEVPETVHVEMEDLQQKSRDLGIYDLKPFLKSKAFSQAGFELEPGGKRISKNLRVE